MVLCVCVLLHQGKLLIFLYLKLNEKQVNSYSQDVHIGNKTTSYGSSVTMNHRGLANTEVVLDYVKSQFPNPKKVLVTVSALGVCQYMFLFSMPLIL